MTYPSYAPNGWKSYGGCLPSHLIETKWFADPTYRAKCVAVVFFEMTKSGPKETKTSKLDALRMKKYYSYFIKQNRSNTLEYLLAHAMAPLDHLFGNHHLCNANWCHCKSIEDKKEIVQTIDKSSERSKPGYYRSMVNDKRLYDAMKIKYAKYITHDF